MSDDSADALLCEAGAHLVFAAQGHPAAANVALALRALLLATECPDYAGASQELVSYLRDAFALALPALADDVDDTLPRMHVAFAIGMARGLLEYCSGPAQARRAAGRDPDFDDEADHTALLASQLEAIHRARRIEARGLRARELVDTKMGIANDRAPEQLLH